MTALERLYNAAVVPVVVLDDAADAVPTAQALLAGGVDVMEITFRTAAAADSIEAVAKECPDMLVGADVFIGVSAPNTVTTEMVKTMNRDAIIFACANPDPEIAYPLAMETRPDLSLIHI